MRWDEQTIQSDDLQRLPGYADGAVVRRFKAPEAMDVDFLEVRAKSALNRVPGAARLPFRWTVNPYRGCTHACVYCLAGDTPILLADGRTRPLAELSAGDAIVGTERRGPYRRFVTTEVLAHWSSVKPPVRVVLEEGTELVASGDHRFLTRDGWRHVAGRSGLTAGAELLGPARLPNTAWQPTAAEHGRGGTVSAALPMIWRAMPVRAIERVRTELELFDITTGTGDFVANGVVSHNCFARPTHEYLDMNAGRDFERRIVVKVNVPEVLRAELARPSWTGEQVALGTNTDPYQWVEKRYGLMRGIWEALRDAANPCSILTKSPLLLRDADLLREIAAVAEVSACLSIPTLDERAWRATEPHTPHPRARLEAVAELNRRGIPTGVLIAPLMPGINDAPEQARPLVAAARAAGAVSVGSNTLFLRGSVRDVFFEWLRAGRPDLLARYARLYRGRAYLPPAKQHEIKAAAGLANSVRYRHRGTGSRYPPESPQPAPERPRPRPAPVQGALF